MVVLIVSNWSENFGDSQAQLKQSFLTAWDTIRSDTKVLLLGIIQSLFEGSMYVFVLEWTPALTIDVTANKEDSSNPPIPHGYIFAAYMVAVMIGANLFKILSKYQECEKFMRIVLLVSAISLTAPFLVPDNQMLIFLSFILFEICVGIFWPSMGTMRGRYVPESARSTLMNFFRIPLNLIVVVILSKDLQLSIIFQFCVGFLFIAAACQFLLSKLVEQKKETKVSLEGN